MIIITCPSCKTKYKHNDDSLKMGDSVECSVCTYDWIISNRNSYTNNKNDQFANVNKKLEEIRLNAKASSTTSFILSSLALILLIFVFAKNQIGKTFPITKNIYYNIGLMERPTPNNTKVFLFLANTTNKVIDGNDSLVLKGVVRNNLKYDLKNPHILVELLNNNGQLVEAREFKFKFQIKPKQTKIIRMVIKNPALGTSSLKLKYIK